MDDADDIIAQLDLHPHPEGGYYRETYRRPDTEGRRDLATAILFLLPAGGRSHWHRVDADELWLWHAGAALDLTVAGCDPVTLGGDILAGQLPQAIVPARAWQSASARGGWALVSCVVSPGFAFAGFELAAPGWAPSLVEDQPQHQDDRDRDADQPQQDTLAHRSSSSPG